MHPWLRLSSALLLSLSSCHSVSDKQLVGDWLSGCSIDICTITSLKADHTYCDQFDEKSITEPSVCGTWRLDGDHLVLNVTWTASAVRPPMLGRQLHFTISDFDTNSFLATLAEDKRWTFRWERRH
jgi:hypothetical protein